MQEFMGSAQWTPYQQHSQGRWPANLLLDKEAAKMLDEQTGILTSGKMNSTAKGGQYNVYGKHYKRKVQSPGSSGGASRFFYCAKAGKSERNLGLAGFKKKKADTRSDVADGLRAKMNAPHENFHPTVKPLALMRYLCTPVRMPNPDQIILDPFAGSGSACMACKQLDIHYIGIEKSRQYCEIAKARIAAIERPQK